MKKAREMLTSSPLASWFTPHACRRSSGDTDLDALFGVQRLLQYTNAVGL